MSQRRYHYEAAFENFLRSRRIPYVGVHEARKTLLPSEAGAGGPVGVGPNLEVGRRPDQHALKSFDFVIYGPGCNLLVEIKGRRATGQRLTSWTTRDDVESLLTWEGLFGNGFQSVFVFLYESADQPPDARHEDVFEYGGRWYAIRSVVAKEYAVGMRSRSERWGTVDVSRRDFEKLSHPATPWKAPGDPGTGRKRETLRNWRMGGGIGGEFDVACSR